MSLLLDGTTRSVSQLRPVESLEAGGVEACAATMRRAMSAKTGKSS